jgi:hypothetical protein
MRPCLCRSLQKNPDALLSHWQATPLDGLDVVKEFNRSLIGSLANFARCWGGLLLAPSGRLLLYHNRLETADNCQKPEWLMVSSTGLLVCSQ